MWFNSWDAHAHEPAGASWIAANADLLRLSLPSNFLAEQIKIHTMKPLAVLLFLSATAMAVDLHPVVEMETG